MAPAGRGPRRRGAGGFGRPGSRERRGPGLPCGGAERGALAMLAAMPDAVPDRDALPRLDLDGALWLRVGGANLGGPGRIALLRAVAEHGSITQAAQAFGMSYKAAWEAIDTMNARAGQALVERAAGGRGGGSTRLTPHGERLVARYGELEAVHRRFLQGLEAAAAQLDRPLALLHILNMQTSARNQWPGEVVALRAGAVNDAIELALDGGERLQVLLTRGSRESLGLSLHQPVLAVIKAQAVMLGMGLDGQVSIPNRWTARVDAVQPGAVQAEVSLRSAGGLPVVALVDLDAVARLGLAPGQAAEVLIPPQDVVLITAR